MAADADGGDLPAPQQHHPLDRAPPPRLSALPARMARVFSRLSRFFGATVTAYLTKDELLKMADRTRKAMEKAARELEFMEAARLRDEYLAIQKLIEQK